MDESKTVNDAVKTVNGESKATNGESKTVICGPDCDMFRSSYWNWCTSHHRGLGMCGRCEHYMVPCCKDNDGVILCYPCFSRTNTRT